MVTVLIGDLFKSRAQTLVNTVNCVGIMGKGLALQFKQHFPDMFEDYARRCQNHQVRLGEPYLYRRLIEPWILNFPTKDHWRSVAKLSDILVGLKYLQKHCKEWGITSLAVPPLGCGEGQLEWRVVGPTLYRYLSALDVAVELYAPFGTPHEELKPAFLEVKSTTTADRNIPSPPIRIDAGWVALVDVLRVLENERFHRPLGRTSFQKLAYFATQSGIPTGLHFQRGSYGPFSPELKTQITKLVNNNLISEERLGRMFAIKTGPTFCDARRAYEGPLNSWQDIIARLADLFLRVDTDQAELAATVHFAARELASERKEPPSEKEVFEEVNNWKLRRRPAIDQNALALSIRNLGALGWLRLRPSSDLPIPAEGDLDV
jgi:O-acetyl-ADP-ribose deacetylase (regulator of RNase III)